MFNQSLIFSFFFLLFYRGSTDKGTLQGRKGSHDAAVLPNEKFSPTEVHYLHSFFYSRFGRSHPSFAHVVHTFPAFGEHEALFKQLFRVLNRKHNGDLDVEEFIFGCSVAGRSCYEQRLFFLFILFDFDEDRMIVVEDVVKMVELIGNFMHRDVLVARKYYSKSKARELFRDSETMLLDRFRQRALGNTVMDHCLKFIDVVFFPVINAMEIESGSRSVFARPLQYVLYEDKEVVPRLLQMMMDHLVLKQKKGSDVSLLFTKKHAREEVDRVSGKIEKAYLSSREGSNQATTECLNEMDNAMVCAVIEKFLFELTESLFPSLLYNEMLNLWNWKKTKKGNTKQGMSLDLLVQFIPSSSMPTFKAVVKMIRDLAEKDGKSEMECLENICNVFGKDLIRPKTLEEDEGNILAVGSLLFKIVEQDLLPDPEFKNEGCLLVDVSSCSHVYYQGLQKALSETHELRTELYLAREEAEMLSKRVTVVENEKDVLNEKIEKQKVAATKMAQKIADMRQELTDLKHDQETASKTKEAKESSAVVKAVGQWLEGSSESTEREALEAIARKEIEMKKKTQGGAMTMKRGTERDAYAHLTEGATDPVTITVEIFCGKVCLFVCFFFLFVHFFFLR